MQYNITIFDLDGTLTDPSLGITNSLMYALAKHNVIVEDRKSLYRFIGPPLLDSFKQFYGFSDEEAWSALNDYREYFSTKGLFENSVIDGCEDMLAALKSAGVTVALATSKPELFAIRILEHFKLNQYFDIVAGASMDQQISAKADIIALVLNSVQDKFKAVMVGDRSHDIFGAKANGIDSIGVLCGFGSEEELKTAGATHIVPHLIDLVPIVIK